MTIESQPVLNFIDYKENDMCVLTGRMDDVQEALCFILSRVSEYFNFDQHQKKTTQDDYLYMIIPNSYVTKLIGQSIHFFLI